MVKAFYHRHQKDAINFFRQAGSILRIFDNIFAPIMDLVRRITFAQVFFISGILKVSNWDTALYLSEHEFPVSWLNPVTAAYLGATIEVICPIFLALGLMSRFAALPMLILTVISQIYYQLINAQVLWILILGYTVVMGSNKISLDYLFSGLKQSALPMVQFLSSIFDFLKEKMGPFYLLFMRICIAIILYLSGLSSMESIGLTDQFNFLGYQPQLSVFRMINVDHLPQFIFGAGAFFIAIGFATRIMTLALLAILTIITQMAQANGAQTTEFTYWIMLLTILFFSGAGKCSLDNLIKFKFSKLFPALEGNTANLGNVPHIVVVGAGFGGVALASELKTTSCRITLIDRRNYLLFQPLLYQIATASLSPSDVATPIRTIFRDQQNIKIVLGEVSGIDKDNKKVILKDDEPLSYDYLVLATGARHSYFGRDEWAEFAPGMKTIEDAIATRSKFLRSFEKAENCNDPLLQEQLLTFLIVGAGPTGVELAGALAELSHQGMDKEFRNIDPRKAKIYLIEAGPRVLAVMPEEVSKYTKTALEKLGVTVMTDSKVEIIDAQGVIVNGKRIMSSNVVWAAGVQASPAAEWLGTEADRAGRIKVSKNFTVPGTKDIYAIGDTVYAEVWNGKPMPGLAPSAKQSGKFVAKHIRSLIEGREAKKEFHYQHYGSLATIGRKEAVADFGMFKLKGSIAWWFWGAIHIMFLSNTQSRLSVMAQWLWAYITLRRSARLITESTNNNKI